MKKAIIYLRTSSDRQADNTSLDTQEEICRSYCQRERFEVVKVMKLEAVSAKETNVQRAAELLEFAKEKQGKFDVLVVFKLDRFARSQEQHHWLRGQLLKLNIIIRSATERIDETPSGKLVEGVLAAVNEYDNEVRKERVKIAMWRRVEEGLWPWQAPLGYFRKKIADIRLTVSEFDANCSQAIIDIFRFYSTGVYTFKGLASLMNKKHIRNWEGRTIKFSQQLIQGMVNNIFYIGLLKNKDGRMVKGQHKPLIELSLWEKCQAVMHKRSNNTINKRLFNNPDFPLRRFTLCGFCEKPLTACWTKGGAGGHYAYYYCRNKNCSKYGKMIPRDTLHDEFLEYIKQIKPKDEFIALFKEVLIDRYKERIQEIKGDYLRQLEAVNQLEKEQEWLVERGKKGIIPDAILQKQLEETEKKITFAKMSLTETHAEELEIDALLNYGLAFIQTPDIAWFDAIADAKIKYQRLIFPSGVRYNFNGFSNSELGLPFKLIRDIASQKTTNVNVFEKIRTYFKQR